ncbi:uncharacterized, partial [Tachysurus ichikawai]
HTSIPGWSASTPASQADRLAHQHPRLVGQHTASQAGRPAASTYSNAGPAYHHPRLVGQHTSNQHLMLDQHTTIPSWLASTPATST